MCQKLSNITGIPWGKDELIASREMGQSGVDVRLVGIALKIIKLSVECKFQESWNVHGWMEQAKENNLPNTDWILVAKRSRKDPVIFMDLNAFIDLFAIVVDKRISDGEFQPIIDAMFKPEKPKLKLVKRKKKLVLKPSLRKLDTTIKQRLQIGSNETKKPKLIRRHELHN